MNASARIEIMMEAEAGSSVHFKLRSGLAKLQLALRVLRASRGGCRTPPLAAGCRHSASARVAVAAEPGLSGTTVVRSRFRTELGRVITGNCNRGLPGLHEGRHKARP
jgi:hypothetical protein